MTNPTDLDVTGLRTAVARVLPHKAAHGADQPLDGLLLDFDGGHLYVVASDRFTLAIGRAAATRPTLAWSAYLDSSEVRNLHRFLELTDPRDPVSMSRDHDEDDGPVLRLRGRHGSVVLLVDEHPGFPDWRKLAAKALDNPALDEPVSLSPGLLQRWAAVGDSATFRLRGACNPVLVMADDFLGLHAPRRNQLAAIPGPDDWHQALTHPRKDSGMPDTTGPAAQLRELAAGFRARTDQARAQARTEREEREREDIAARAAKCMERLFPQTLGLVLPPEAWRGYPAGQESTAPLAVAHLGEGMFVTYECRRAATDDPWSASTSTFDVVVVLMPCSCGNYVECIVDSDYSLALALDEAEIITTCLSMCTPSGAPEEA
ncbi:hypothetical protein [Streptomyces sp. XH2]|uniref:hypothetical protein n=1 Tax=Streptomyces sp. XH2 TaxID=3412483 RepID=UPI003C7C3FC6